LQKKKICKPIYDDAERSSILLELETTEGKKKNQHVMLQQSGIFGEYKQHKSPDEITDKNAYIRELQQENDTLRKKNMELMAQMNLVKSGGSITNNHNNNVYNINNITNNINIYGNENRSYLTEDVLTSIMSQILASVPTLIKELHFNPDHPENHNIRYPNKKDKFILVKKSPGEWNHVDKKQFIQELTMKGHNYLEDAYEMGIMSAVKPDKQASYKRYIANMKKEDNSEILGDICSRVEVVMLDARYNSQSRKSEPQTSK
tara:strand:- start:964 stop:1746 length:783 start_codon:yes stop_codon:yes gene_type:complete